jgi:membrane peptidoglycan carboxypeptidase
MHQVLSQSLDSQVQYAMEMTTVDGTGTAASLGPNVPILGKTGTTTNSKSAFFIGAIPQWTLAVGIFTEQQNPNSPETLTALGGGGFGGTWPAAIWHTFMSDEFGNLSVQQFLNPIFTGEKWDQVGKVPAKKKPKPKPTVTGNPHRHGGPTPTGTSTTGFPFPTVSPSPSDSTGTSGPPPTPTP